MSEPLNGDQIRAQRGKVATLDIPVPEWGDEGSVLRVKSLGSGARLKWVIARDNAIEGKPGPDPTALLIVLAAVNPDGSKAFNVQDCDWLAEEDGKVINRITDKILVHSGMAEDDAADAEGKSDATTSGDSSSSSATDGTQPPPS